MSKSKIGIEVIKEDIEREFKKKMDGVKDNFWKNASARKSTEDKLTIMDEMAAYKKAEEVVDSILRRVFRQHGI